MGDPDLSRGGSTPTRPAPTSVPELIRAGDSGAFADFRHAHIGMVRAYCEVACAPELVDETCEAVFLDFVGRICGADPGEQGPEAVLLAATRSAAASRFATPPPEATQATEAGSHRGRRQSAPSPQIRICAAMPELLAARANGDSWLIVDTDQGDCSNGRGRAAKPWPSRPARCHRRP